MTKEEIIQKVKELHLAKGSYVVFGSCPLAIAGIRPAGDIDMLVSEELFESFKKAGWQEVNKGPGDKPLTHNVFEVHKSWSFAPPYNPTLEHLLSTATIIDSVPISSLEEVRKWKLASARPKDLADIKLIDEYLIL